MKSKKERVKKGWKTKHSNRFTSDFKSEFIELYYNKNWTFHQVMTHFKITHQCLSAWMKREKLEKTKFITAKSKLLQNNKSKIISLYKDKNSCQDVASKYNVSTQLIARFLQKQGISRRSIAEANTDNPKIKGVSRNFNFQRKAVMFAHKNLKVKNVPTAGMGIGYIPDLVAVYRGKIIGIELSQRLTPGFRNTKIKSALNKGYDYLLFRHQINNKMMFYDMNTSQYLNKIPSVLQW